MRSFSASSEAPVLWKEAPVLWRTVTLILMLGLLLPGCCLGAAVYNEEPYVTTARCRIQCVKKFIPDVNSQADDNACRKVNNYKDKYNRDCQECWDSCFTLIGSQARVNMLCPNDKLPGLQLACEFVQHRHIAPPTLHGLWNFTEKVKADSDQYEITLKWKPPSLVPGSANVTSASDVIKPGPIVYILMHKETERKSDDQEEWIVNELVLSQGIRISKETVPDPVDFWLLAVTEYGQIASTRFKPESLVKELFEGPTGEMLELLRQEETSSWYIEKLSHINANLSMDTPLVREGKQSYHAQTASVVFRGPDRLSSQDVHIYRVVWMLVDCKEAYHDVPRCNIPAMHMQTAVSSRGSEPIEYVIRDLHFNSIYKLIIFLVSDRKVRAELVFKTSPCYAPDYLQRTQCLDDIDENELPDMPVKKDPIHIPEFERPRLFVNVSSMTLEAPDHVIVNITWTPVLWNQSGISYNVTTYVEGTKSMGVDVIVTSQPFIVLSLQQDTQYLVKVETTLKLYPGDDPELTSLTEMLMFNTSDVNLAMYQEPVAYRYQNEDEMNQVNGIIIGVTCVVTIFVLVILAAILYKKRKTFKDIIVPKATVAKSNSYKSNVGGKSDYSNQLIVFSDEWELDPLKLKFSTLLGQGAFGKVVTGYYEDQKVAIKLVREGAPMSYKEDLVAEIQLMKRIGSHPNIVCLIGACTLAEPIALVMEYVPYGNLQNFLKKCRLDGDLRKRTDGTSEITYTMVQESGGIENGVVTPADMLSFARQVAMAMEYLTDKKYVHRDLAARNVLIDYNKVVKVCDFGLSRDIFNDNHYKKLTNGKLPLKWMAIESLRDRIFTTQSDVWSFGILLWEIVTMGASPYPNVALADLYYVLSTGYRMDRPSNCSDELYAIMRSCWEDEPTDRPNFTQLRFMLEELLTEDRNYLVLEDIDVPLTNSDNSSSPTPSGSDNDASAAAAEGATAGPRSYPTTSASHLTSTTNPSHPVKMLKKPSPRRDNMRINVCIHQKSTDRLIRPSESDSSPSSC